MPYTSSPPTSAISSLKCVKSTKKRTFKPETANWVHRADPSASPELSPHSDPTQLRSTLLLRTIRICLRMVGLQMVEVPETIEQLVPAAAAPPEGIRFSIMIDSGDDAPGGKSDNLSVGEKRKHAELELDVEFGSNDEVVLWRANFEEFIRCLRHKACVENVTARLDDEAAVVLRAMLKATRTAEKKVKTENSVPLSQNTIYEEVINSEAGRSLTMGRVRDSLSGLCDSSPERDVDEDESYSAENS